MSNIRIANNLVGLPRGEGRIPTPKVRAAFEHALKLKATLGEAMRERDAAAAAVTNVANAERIRLGDLYDADPDYHDDNLGEAVEEAQRQKRKSQERVDALVLAEQKAVVALREAITDERDLWQTIARADAKKALTKLATAVRMAEGARDDLAATLGVLRILETPGQLTPTLVPGGYDLAPPIGGLREALAKATHELAARS